MRDPAKRDRRSRREKRRAARSLLAGAAVTPSWWSDLLCLPGGPHETGVGALVSATAIHPASRVHTAWRVSPPRQLGARSSRGKTCSLRLLASASGFRALRRGWQPTQNARALWAGSQSIARVRAMAKNPAWGEGRAGTAWPLDTGDGSGPVGHPGRIFSCGRRTRRRACQLAGFGTGSNWLAASRQRWIDGSRSGYGVATRSRPPPTSAVVRDHPAAPLEVTWQ